MKKKLGKITKTTKLNMEDIWRMRRAVEHLLQNGAQICADLSTLREEISHLTVSLDFERQRLRDTKDQQLDKYREMILEQARIIKNLQVTLENIGTKQIKENQGLFSRLFQMWHSKNKEHRDLAEREKHDNAATNPMSEKTREMIKQIDLIRLEKHFEKLNKKQLSETGR